MAVQLDVNGSQEAVIGTVRLTVTDPGNDVASIGFQVTELGATPRGPFGPAHPAMGADPGARGALSSSGAAGRRRNRPQRVFRSGLYPMKVTFFSDTDTLYIEFKPGSVAETRDLDENTLLELDATGRICAITVEHATERTGIPTFSYEQVAA